MYSPDTSANWQKLTELAEAKKNTHLAEVFARDSGRAERYSAETCGLYLDYSKQGIDDDIFSTLLALAEESGLREKTKALFAGEKVNNTEGRSVLHAALRAPKNKPNFAGDQSHSDLVHGVLDSLLKFAEKVRAGDWKGATGKKITTCINIGIGGSDLGPRMAVDALSEFADGPEVKFVANVDGTELDDTLKQCDAETTLVIITSKTFTTQETMANANAARAWLVKKLGAEAVSKHFVAVSTNAEAVAEFGIDTDNMFGFWEWVGGRYSLWSAVGLSLALAVGKRNFRELLRGAHEMDSHFVNTDWAQNLPVIMALLCVWNTNFLKLGSHVMAPYNQRLLKVSAWLQQLEMESNGKSVTREGRPVSWSTTPVHWGDIGTNAQHAYFQMLHQGTQIQATDFILPIKVSHPYSEQHRMLMANCFAQSSAFMLGKTADQVREELTAKGMSGDELDAAIPHRVFKGNRPSNTILMNKVAPFEVGALLALYEQRTFVLSVLWDVNAYDQWGVELGKQLTGTILKNWSGGADILDESTQALLKRCSVS